MIGIVGCSDPESLRTSIMSAPHVAFVGIGNPLLDISTEVDVSYPAKFNLNPNEAYLASPETEPLFKELESMPNLSLVPGGASQNTTRVVQWILHEKESAAYFGCIANDHFGNKQKEIMEKQNVKVCYDVTDEKPTGTCAALNNAEGRCLVANIASAGCFKATHLLKPDNLAIADSAKVAYTEGFFTDVSMESLLIIAHRRLKDQDKYFSMNLSAQWVIQGHTEKILELFPYADFVFCNEDEARCFAEVMGWAEKVDLVKIAAQMSLFPKHNPAKQRIVCITHGPEPITLATAFGKDEDKKLPYGHGCIKFTADCGSACTDRATVKTYPVPVIPKEEFKDANGCGDSFVGGFIASFIKGLPLEKCVENGNFIAGIITRSEGCTFPTVCPLKL